jgi:hypothetical protein
MSDLSVRPYNEGRVRAADSLLRSQGGFNAGLRLPAPTAAGVNAEQLGLSAPQFQDLPLGPAVFRKVRIVMAEGQSSKYELLISASAVAAAVSGQAVASADVLFAMATGIAVNGVLFLIGATSFTDWQGQVCVYRVLLRESLPDAAEETVS